MTDHTKRPALVTFLTVLGVLQGITGVLLGVFLVADRNDATLLRRINESDAFDAHQVTSDVLLVAGVVALVFGALVIAIALALGQGKSFARWLLAIGCVTNAAVGLHSLIVVHGEQQFTGSLSLAFSLFTLWVLFGSEAKEYFERSPRS